MNITNGPILLLIKINLTLNSDLRMPNKKPKEFKEELMKYLLNLK